MGSRWNEDWSKVAFGAAGELSTMAITVSVFYFGYYAISNVVGRVKEKKE